MCKCHICANKYDFPACSHVSCFVGGKYSVFCCSAGWRKALLMLNTRPFKCEVMHEADVALCTFKASWGSPNIWLSQNLKCSILSLLFIFGKTQRIWHTSCSRCFPEYCTPTQLDMDGTPQAPFVTALVKSTVSAPSVDQWLIIYCIIVVYISVCWIFNCTSSCLIIFTLWSLTT